jgi:hypothetical protein
MVEWAETEEQLATDRTWYQAVWALSMKEKLDYSRDWLQNQSALYSCGTAMCLAGKVALDAGWKFVIPQSDIDQGIEDVRKDGSRRSISEVAREELGLTRAQANTLFGPDNKAADIRQIAERFAGEKL